jgi:hypothetical protein
VVDPLKEESIVVKFGRYLFKRGIFGLFFRLAELEIS